MPRWAPRNRCRRLSRSTRGCTLSASTSVGIKQTWFASDSPALPCRGEVFSLQHFTTIQHENNMNEPIYPKLQEEIRKCNTSVTRLGVIFHLSFLFPTLFLTVSSSFYITPFIYFVPWLLIGLVTVHTEYRTPESHLGGRKSDLALKQCGQFQSNFYPNAAIYGIPRIKCSWKFTSLEPLYTVLRSSKKIK